MMKIYYIRIRLSVELGVVSFVFILCWACTRLDKIPSTVPETGVLGAQMRAPVKPSVPYYSDVRGTSGGIAIGLP